VARWPRFQLAHSGAFPAPGRADLAGFGRIVGYSDITVIWLTLTSGKAVIQPRYRSSQPCRSAALSLQRIRYSIRLGDSQAKIALIDGKNEQIRDACQIDEAEPVGDKHRGIAQHNLTQYHVAGELGCA